MSLAMKVTVPDEADSVSVRKIVRGIEVNRESVRLIAKNELNLKPYKLQKMHLRTDDNKRVRLQRCRQLKRWAAGQKWERILFTDEKIFTIQQAHNHQNDRSWFAEAPGTSAIIERRQCEQSLMVWGGICATGKTPLVFIDQEVKINQEVYRRDILILILLNPMDYSVWSILEFRACA
ncbi:uncharacterized protein [Drosophila bipectinata]|uniref:uncharacterized protein n=1 Tax=Drosophila bipectinata TaxID=42026 RepID=UPI0038B2F025